MKQAVLLKLYCFGTILTLCLMGRAGYGQRFAAIGDYGYAGPNEQKVAELVKGWDPEVIITLGDNNYDVGDSSTIDKNIGQYYHTYIYNYRGRYGPSASSNRFFPSLGNHDYYTRNGEPYRDYFTLPGNGRYYDFVRGDVHFFALNSDPAEPDGIADNSKQAQWLRARLAASTARWKVVYFHHAPYSSGLHGSTSAMQWPFKEWGASVVLTGHDHDYERLSVNGLTYFVNGLGGRSIYKTTRSQLPQSQLMFNGDYGAMRIDATPDSMTLQFITKARAVVDSYVLHQTLSPEPLLYPVAPNPVQRTALISFSIPSPLSIRLRVLNSLGQEVAVLRAGLAQAGWHRLEWARETLPVGLYYVQLQSSMGSLATRILIQ